MKTVSICIGCYNEEGNIRELYDRLTQVMATVPQYKYEIIFEDNDSTDNTQTLLREIAEKDKRVKLIFNMRNYGVARSGRNCVYNASGDVIISIVADLQDPPELIPQLLKYWEEGYLLVLGQKKESAENGFKFKLRKLYYKIIQSFSDIPQMDQYSGFGAVDKKVYEQIKACDERTMSFRHLIPDLGYKCKFIPYTQQKRKHGKSSYNLRRYLDFSITSLVTTSKFPIRLATVLGVIGSAFALIIECIALIFQIFANNNKLRVQNVRRQNEFFLISFIQIFFIGIVGEYLLEVVEKNRKRPLVIEKERINF